ncbi:MAG: hypothetical protein ABIR34_04550 [Marmoricola sp.]
MPFVAANGVLILVPAVIYLDRLASRGDFGTMFVTVQSIELIAGLVNLLLMSLNIRDGMQLAGHLGAKRMASQAQLPHRAVAIRPNASKPT